MPGFGAFAWLALRTLDETKVSGPLYQTIVQGHEVIADVLPPPAYILESHLLALQMLTAGRDDLRQLVDRSAALRRTFEERHRHWLEALPPGTLRRTMVEAAEDARQFFALRDGDYLSRAAEMKRQDATRPPGTPKRARAHREYTPHSALDKVTARSTGLRSWYPGVPGVVFSRRA